MNKNKNEKIKKKYRENMTDEQKQKYKESEKRYRENMTDEQKQKQRDYQKEYRKNITDEQKQRYISSVKWTVLANFGSQPRGQNFQTQI